MNTTRTFADVDRYLFDFNLCTPSKGWAQFDTRQDASYFGNWINPTSYEIMSYAEGDVTRHKCDSAAEFAAEVRRMADWHTENDDKPARIDGMCNPEIIAACQAAGLGDLLH